MRVEPRRDLPALDAEQEIDFSRYTRAIATRWWLLVIGAVVGLLIGLGITVGKGRPYEATTIVYLGQPYTPGQAGTPIQSLPLKIGFVAELVSSKASLATVAAKAGVRRGLLASRISVNRGPGINPTGREPLTSILEIKVNRLPPRKAIIAADAVAAIVVRFFSTYVDQKLSTYNKRLARANRKLAQINVALANAQEQQKVLINDHGLPPTEKLLLLANINNTVNVLTTRQNNLESQQFSLNDVIALAQQVEKARIVEPATAQRVAPPSRRASALVGGFVGLIIGLLATLLWDPVVRRVRPRPA